MSEILHRNVFLKKLRASYNETTRLLKDLRGGSLQNVDKDLLSYLIVEHEDLRSTYARMISAVDED